jgi:hypothetical protein
MTPDDGTPKSSRHRFPFGPAVFDLLACIVGFSLAIWLYSSLSAGAFLFEWSAEFTREAAVSALTAWIAIAFTWNPWSDRVRLWIDRLFSAIGFNLMVQYGLDYFFHAPPTPWPAAILGSVFSIALLSLYRNRPDLTHPQHAGGTLLLGYDSVAESIRSILGRVVGVLTSAPNATPIPSPAAPADFRQLGDLSRLDEVLAAEKPARLVVNDPSWSSAISPRRLLALRYAGVVV